MWNGVSFFKPTVTPVPSAHAIPVFIVSIIIFVSITVSMFLPIKLFFGSEPVFRANCYKVITVIMVVI